MTQGVAAEHHVEGERSIRLGEEPLGPRLPAQSPAEHVGPEVVGGQCPGHPRPGEQTLPEALGSIFEQGGEDVPAAHQVDRSAAEVPDVAREREGGELGHRIRHFVTHAFPDEDAALESAGQGHDDPVGGQGGHPQPAFRIGAGPKAGSNPGRAGIRCRSGRGTPIPWRSCNEDGYRLGSPGRMPAAISSWSLASSRSGPFRPSA